MRAEEVAALYTLLAERGIRVRVDGGRGFDALVPFDDLGALVGALARRGFTLKGIRAENR